MRRLVTALAAAAAIALSAAPAYAQTALNLGPNETFLDPLTGEFGYFFVSDPGADAMGDITATFGHQGIPSTPSLIDTFHFTLNDTGTGSGSVTTEVSLAGLPTDTDLLNVWINGILANHTVNDGLTDQWSATNVPIAFGVENFIQVEYLSRGAGHYAGTAEFTPLGVPEPATWAMMLIGFGAIGLSFRKRNAAIPQLA